MKSKQNPRDKTRRLELRNMWSLTKGIQGLKGRGTVRKTGVGQQTQTHWPDTEASDGEAPACTALGLNARIGENLYGVTETDGLMTEQRQEPI